MIHFQRPSYQLTKYGPWIQIDSFFSTEECSKVIAQMPDRKLSEAMVSEYGVKNISIRSTKVCALDYDPKTKWVFDKLEAAITQVNNDVYGMEILGLHEAIQLMEYRVGDFYSQHMDYGNLQFSRRKISFSVQLTDPQDYEGGELEFHRNGTAPKEKGTLILFPSYFYHEVKPITRGIRRVLVGWTDGPPLK